MGYTYTYTHYHDENKRKKWKSNHTWLHTYTNPKIKQRIKQDQTWKKRKKKGPLKSADRRGTAAVILLGKSSDGHKKRQSFSAGKSLSSCQQM